MRTVFASYAVTVLLLSLSFNALGAGADEVSYSSAPITPVAERNIILGIILWATLLGGGSETRQVANGREYRTDHDRVPEPDPTRKVNVQDCTRPVDLNGGNLRCQ